MTSNFRLFGFGRGGDAVTRALRDGEVQGVLASAGRGEPDLRELSDRLLRSGVEPKRVGVALRDTALLRWFFDLPDLNQISLDDSLRLINWARYGAPQGPV